jgi:serine/threonine protein kinase
MSDENKRERFGRYLILDHLVDGGMAKICRARFLGEQADKIVAIKMVQPQYSKDEAFKSMFMDEIKVTFGLLHPNVIQTYDYGIHQGQLFVAMEYCDGRNLKEYLEKLKERKFVFPVEISTFIISQACQGLYYAHTFRDKLTGVETHIIHRDISPHNIMLTYDGAVKIIDFGIAKSQKNSEATQAGTIKGKLSYLAPEYLEGLELDARYDQFALGITLWEMLCSRKLFKENNDLAVLKKIQECKIPAPSSINPNVPKELDEIVLKALSKDRNKRFENLDQMNRALMKFLYAKYPDFNGTDLSYFAQELFREDIKKDREKLFEFGKIDIRPYLDALRKELEGGTNEANKVSRDNEERRVDTTPAPKREQVLDFGFTDDAANGTMKSRSKIKAAATNNTLTGKKKKENDNLTSVTGGSISKMASDRNKTGFHQLKNGTNTKSSPNGKNEGTNTRILREVQIKKAKKSSMTKIVALFVLVLGMGAYIFQTEFSNSDKVVEVKQPIKKKHRGPMPASVNTEQAEASDKGTIVLTHFDRQKMQVFIDGEKQDVDIISSIKVPLMKDFTLRVQIEGRKHFIKSMRVDNKASVEIEVTDMPAIPYGYIHTSAECTKGEITFELWGEKRKSKIPLTESFGIALPLQVESNGTSKTVIHELFFKREGDTVERKIEVTLSREDETIDLCEKL